MNDKALLRLLGICVTVLIAVKVITAAVMPLTLDEGYYLWWSLAPKLGYLDHPPLIAYLLAFSGKIPQYPLFTRWPSLLLSFLMFPISWSLISQLNYKERGAKLTAFFLCHVNLLGVLCGVIPTPDMPFMFFWLLALHEALFALTHDPKRWLTAGIATGLGIWSKYTMVLIGPVFLWALLREKQQLRTKWPYLGGVLCFALLGPHLMWLQKNDWSSLKFQLRHGFVGDHSAAPTNSSEAIFPDPIPAVAGTIEQRVGDFFNLDRDKIEQPKEPTPPLVAFFNRILDYAGSQITWWGLFLFGFIYAGWHQRKVKSWRESAFVFKEPARHLVYAATLFPLGFFLLVTCFTAGEVNWPVAYLIGASLWLAAWRPLPPRYLLVVLGTHGVLLLAIAIHAQFPQGTKKPHKDRILVETHGFPKLAEYLTEKTDLIMVDTYQMASQLTLRLPGHLIAQWPEITRRSEFNYRSDLYNAAAAKIKVEHGFWLLSHERTPPTLPGYNLMHYEEIRDCLNGPLVVTPYTPDTNTFESCEPYVHRWFLGHYQQPMMYQNL